MSNNKKKEFNLKITPLDELFMTQKERDTVKLPSIYDIPLSEIDNFPNHPFKVRNDEDMSNLIESIREHGVISPAMVRKKEDGRYEMISGHRRKRACELLGMETLRCEVVNVSRDEATVLMVDSNSQRSVISPCDKGKAYRMRLEAMNRQGKRSDLISVPVGQKLKFVNSRDELADSVKESSRQIARFIRLTYLIPELQKFVDDGSIKVNPAVELSYLDEKTQRIVADLIGETKMFPSQGQAKLLRRSFETGTFDRDTADIILREQKQKPEKKYKFSAERLTPLLPKGYTPMQQEDYIYDALVCYQKYLRRQRENTR